MKSFYAELIDNMGIKIKHLSEPAIPVPPVLMDKGTLDCVPIIHDSMSEVEIRSDDAVDGAADAAGLAKFLDENPDFGHTDVTPVGVRTPEYPKAKDGYQIVHEEEPVKMVSTSSAKNDGTKEAEDFDCNTFASHETKFYGGFKAMKDCISVEYALASDFLTRSAEGFLESSKLIQDYPLAVRITKAEFAATRADKELPFLVAVAENDFGARVCRVFTDLKRIATAGGYSAEQLQVTQTALYCGQVGPKDGQLHAWPHPEHIGVIDKEGRVDAKRVALVCKAIAERLPKLDGFLNDLYADACSAQAGEHRLMQNQLDVLAALYAEVQA